MTNKELSEKENLIRYLRPSWIDDKGEVHSQAFKLRKSDVGGLSVNWPDAFEPPRESQLAEIRSRFRLERRNTGKFAEFNIGKVKNLAFVSENCSLQFSLIRFPNVRGSPVILLMH